MPTEQGKITKKRKHEGKLRDKWPKRARENREKSTRQTHLDRTRGTQQIKHQLDINVSYMKYEGSNSYVFISSKQTRIQTRGQLMSQQFTIVIKQRSSLTKRRRYAFITLIDDKT